MEEDNVLEEIEMNQDMEAELSNNKGEEQE